jgi:hypothetical protein
MRVGRSKAKDQHVRNGAARLFAVTRFRIRYYFLMKIRDLTEDQLLSVRCPTCGAAIKERCELNTGRPRNEPHRDRKFLAAEAVEPVPEDR